MESRPTYNVGIGFFSLLALLFIALKLMGYIEWSWLWVTSPMWGPLLLFVVVFIIMVVVAVINVLKDSKRRERIREEKRKRLR